VAIAEIYSAGAMKWHKSPEKCRFSAIIGDCWIRHCIVGSPLHLHAPHFIDTINARKDLYCEKTMTWSIPEAEECLAKAKNSDRVVQIGRQHESSGAMAPGLSLLAIFAPPCSDRLGRLIGFNAIGRLEIDHESNVGESQPKRPGFRSPVLRHVKHKGTLRAGILKLHPCQLHLCEKRHGQSTAYCQKPASEQCEPKGCNSRRHPASRGRCCTKFDVNARTPLRMLRVPSSYVPSLAASAVRATTQTYSSSRRLDLAEEGGKWLSPFQQKTDAGSM
jgi:hypothetical protein